MVSQNNFFELTPQHILEAVEAIGFRSTGRCFALNSLENRVYEVEMEDENRFVGKFYRPNRWTKEAILEEHGFLGDLAKAEIPVAQPMVMGNSSTIGKTASGILFAVFPKVRGRVPQELDQQQYLQLGRFLGRLHTVGASKSAQHRMALTPQTYGLAPLKFLDEKGFLPMELASQYKAKVIELVDLIAPWFENIHVQRIHGDCHMGNLLYNGDGPFFLDFDDMVIGPPVQDIWLIAGGSDEQGKRDREIFLKGYCEMREFEMASLRLIEPLRALRFIHYSAWIAKRWDDPAFPRAFPEFNTYKYWLSELQDLQKQLDLIRQGNCHQN